MSINSDVTKASEFVLVYKDGKCFVCQENIYQVTTCDDSFEMEIFTNMEDMESRAEELGLTPFYPE